MFWGLYLEEWMNVFSQVTWHLYVSGFTDVYLKILQQTSVYIFLSFFLRRAQILPYFCKCVYLIVLQFFRIVTTVSFDLVKWLQNI
jgi:hypothetical protein